MVGTCTIPLTQLLADAPRANEKGLYGEEVDGKHDMRELTVRASSTLRCSS